MIEGQISKIEFSKGILIKSPLRVIKKLGHILSGKKNTITYFIFIQILDLVNEEI